MKYKFFKWFVRMQPLENPENKNSQKYNFTESKQIWTYKKI